MTKVEFTSKDPHVLSPGAAERLLLVRQGSVLLTHDKGGLPDDNPILRLEHDAQVVLLPSLTYTLTPLGQYRGIEVTLGPVLRALGRLTGTHADLIELPKSDTVDLPRPAEAIYLPAAGTVRFETLGGTEHTLDLSEGYHPFAVRKIFDTDTTATTVLGAI